MGAGGAAREGRGEEERDRHSITALLTVPPSSPILMDLRLQSLPADARTGSSEACGALWW